MAATPRRSTLPAVSAAAARAPAAKAKRAAYNRTYYLAHRERILAKNRAWSHTHPERIAELRAARAGEQRAEQHRATAQARPT